MNEAVVDENDPTAQSDVNLTETDVQELQRSINEHPIIDSSYFDVSSMAPLNSVSAQALSRLRAYRPPPFAAWAQLPAAKRAAVLILLFADRRGDLRVVLTLRASTLRDYSGDAAFPGGKADDLRETPFDIARREAFEEIGLPDDPAGGPDPARRVPAPFRVEHLCQLPCSLAKTRIAVRPCVAFLHVDAPAADGPSLVPTLDAKEVAAVFSAPLHNFLMAQDEARAPGHNLPGKPADWYHGKWVDGPLDKFRMHKFYVPINNQRVTKPRKGSRAQTETAQKLDLDEEEKEEEEGLSRYLVWGMTAKICVEAARLAYGEVPEFEHDVHIGDEDLINKMAEIGEMDESKGRYKLKM